MKQIMDLFLTFGRIGAFTFGGGYAMLSLLNYECVEKKKWITEDELMDGKWKSILTVCGYRAV
ncbi:MAG: chromate transporter [Lachnospiraceae bacterium]|nr:chromate transporter [Lachnospiraceae bacterium]